MKKRDKIAIITLSIIIASNLLILSQIYHYSYRDSEIVASFEKPFGDDYQLAMDKLLEYGDLLWDFSDALTDAGLQFKYSIENRYGRYWVKVSLSKDYHRVYTNLTEILIGIVLIDIGILLVYKYFKRLE